MDISDLSTRQVANALVIFAAATPYGPDAVKGALITAAAESSFRRYANNGESERSEVWAAYGGRQNFRDVIRASLLYPHDAEAGAAWTTADSCGLFQQRPMYDYGSIKDLMDPAESTRIFIRGSHGGTGRTRYFLQAPSGLSLAARCQWTQGSEFPTGENYAPMEPVANQLINHFGGLPVDNNTDWIDMADQAALDRFANQVADLTVARLRALPPGDPFFVSLYRTQVAGEPYDEFLAGLKDLMLHMRDDTPNHASLSAQLDALLNR